MSLFQHKTLPKAIYNTRTSQLAGMRFSPNPGLKFGLELEVENAGNVRYPDTFGDFWTTHEDGSLRNNGIEYVTRGNGLTKEKTLEALNILEVFLKNNPQLQFSERTSFHVHINFTDRTLKDFHNFLTLYYMVENLLTLRAGFEGRVGNHFCLRVQDANTTKKALLEAFSNYVPRMFELEKYLALNLNSFQRFGTLEVRCHRGTNDVNEFRAFIDVLEELYTHSQALNEPREIFQGMSTSGFVEFFDEFIPVTMKYLRADPQKLIDNILILNELNNAMTFCQGLANVVKIVDEPRLKDKEGLSGFKSRPTVDFARLVQENTMWTNVTTSTAV